MIYIVPSHFFQCVQYNRVPCNICNKSMAQFKFVRQDLDSEGTVAKSLVWIPYSVCCGCLKIKIYDIHNPDVHTRLRELCISYNEIYHRVMEFDEYLLTTAGRNHGA